MSEIQNQNTEQNNKLVEYEKICKTQNEKIIILEKSLEVSLNRIKINLENG